MSTVLQPPSPRGPWSPDQQRVRHPLQALRKYIRLYVTLEGTFTAILFIAACFWIGLALDYGAFWLFSFDWLQTLQYMETDQVADIWLRLVVVSSLGIILVGLVATKVVLRLLREFSDPAVALVLERRFPRELGDRLITAVELADTQAADRYGMSAELVEQTIHDAAERVEKLPVTQVFNWTRLNWLGAGSVLATVGLYLAVGIGWYAARSAAEEPASPGVFFHQFNDVAGIWAERSLFFQSTYWPRNAYLEILHFQDTPDHPGELRVARDDNRPDLRVRAVQWVVADGKVQGGWRALRWADLSNLLDGEEKLVDIPSEFPDWVIDLADLDPKHGDVVPALWQGRTSGQVRKELARLEGHAGLRQAVEELLEWRSWTVDKLQLQEGKGEVRRALRDSHADAHQALENVFARLEELALAPSMGRRLRKLTIPRVVEIYYWGKKAPASQPFYNQPDNKYSYSLNDLKESVRFTVIGEDYTTPYKSVTLVPPPSLAALWVDKEEPAYLFYRLQGDQGPLKGKKQVFRNYPISVSGESSALSVPFGSDLTLWAKADRDLQDGILVRAPEKPGERGALVPKAEVTLDADRRSFSMPLPNVTRTYEFFLEFTDKDNVKGRRRVVIRSTDDRAPEVLDVELAYVPSKPLVKEAAKSQLGAAAEAFLITPEALVPFKGLMRDDYGLTAAHWAYEVEQVDVELVGLGSSETGKEKEPLLTLRGNAPVRRGGLIASALQVLPGSPGLALYGPFYWAWITRVMAVDVAHGSRQAEPEKTAPLELFLRRIDERSIDDVPLATLEHRLFQKPPARGLFKEHLLKEEDGFDLKRHLPKLLAKDREPQMHFLVRVAVSATDNNVETGPSSARNKAPFLFLVVSENELLRRLYQDETDMRRKLEAAMKFLNDARTVMDEQVLPKLATAKEDYNLVQIRVSEGVRKKVLDAAGLTREVHTVYQRLLRELEVNRVKGNKIPDVRDKILFPLEEIVNPNFGNFTLTEDAVQKLYQALDEDLASLRQVEGDKAQMASVLGKIEANRPLHLQGARSTRENLDRLMERLNSIILAMDEGIVFSKLVEMIVEIERGHRRAVELLRIMHDDRLNEILKGITGS